MEPTQPPMTPVDQTTTPVEVPAAATTVTPTPPPAAPQPTSFTPTDPQPPTPAQPAPFTPAAAQPPAAAPAPPPPPDTIAQIAAQPHAADEISTNEIYATICSQIIKEQGQIIGALTYEQASHVPGLTVDPTTYVCVINGDGIKVLEDLVNKYREFFGNAAVEVCREAAARFASRLPNEQMPAVLRG